MCLELKGITGHLYIRVLGCLAALLYLGRALLKLDMLFIGYVF